MSAPGRPNEPAEPFLSLLVPAYRTPPRYLAEMLASVRGQTDPGWQLVVVDDGSDDPELAAALAAATTDPRVVVHTRRTNGGIVAATRDALAIASGEFIGLLDHDDVLDPRAVERVRAAIATAPDTDVVYTDEDQIDADGRPRGEFRKPAFSPERLRGQMYLGHLLAYRRDLLERVGGFREGYDGSQDYDLALRATEQARRVTHLPEVLYHWRIHEQSVSHRDDNDAVFDAARRALADHLDRTGIRGRVEQVHPVGVYRIHRRPARYPRVSLVVPTRGSRGFVRGADRSLVEHALSGIAERSTYPDIEVVVVADRATPAATRSALREQWGRRLTVVPYEGPFNFSAQVNRGVLHSTGELVVLLNDDVESVTDDWLETMAGLALESDVGMVGAKLLYEDRTLQHIGHLYERNDCSHVAAGAPADWPGLQADLLVDREVSGVTAACAMLRREVFEQVGGLSPDLPINFNDVDLSMKITEAGYRIVVTPHAVLFHFESKSRHRTVTATEVTTLRARWNRRLQIDPYWRHDPAAVRAAVEAYRTS